MPATTLPGRVCGYCDGFPRVAITLGLRRPDGTRRLVHVVCPACRGTGTIPTPTATVRLADAASVGR